MSIFGGLSSLLSCAAVYRCFGHVVRGNASTIYLSEYVKPIAGEKVLDIGCGPADILKSMPDVHYTGFDINRDYIASAQKRFGNKGRFFCDDVGMINIEQELGTFDLVMAIGVVHHLNDAQAQQLFQLARTALRPEGRMITFDGCYVSGQSKITAWLLSRDRGKFVRAQTEYVRLASASFSKVEAHVRHDLLRIPYTHLIMRCSSI
jgi:cyclopropane fatty-acyl-phospholipid synthase-like methyltransferase